MIAVAAKVNGVLLTGGSGWSIENVLKNAGDMLRNIGVWFLVIVGIIMILVGGVKIAQGLISHGKTQVSWVVNILLIIVGALFCAGGGLFMTLTSSDEDGFGAAISNELENLGH